LELPGVGNLLFVVEVNVEENELEKPEPCSNIWLHIGHLHLPSSAC